MTGVAIFGAFGDLGSELVMQALRSSKGVMPFGRRAGDVRDLAWIRKALTARKPEVVINATAYHKVDEAEQNLTEALSVNAEAVRNIADVCAEIGSLLVHFSSDYVFDGRQRHPYTEEDKPNPINAYGRSKVQGEIVIGQSGCKWIIVRTSGLFGSLHGASSKGGDFVKRILHKARSKEKLEIVEDMVFAPSYAPYVAKIVMEIVKAGHHGVFHIVNRGEVGWADYAQDILDIAGIRADVIRVSAADREAQGAAPRPRYSVLSSVRSINGEPISPPPYRPMLEEYIKRLRP